MTDNVKQVFFVQHALEHRSISGSVSVSMICSPSDRRGAIFPANIFPQLLATSITDIKRGVSHNKISFQVFVAIV